MFDLCIWTEAVSVPLLSEIFTARGCSIDQTIWSGAQPSWSLHTKEGEIDNDRERDWLVYKWYKAMGLGGKNATHARLRVSLTLMNPFFFFLSLLLFLSSFFSFPVYLIVPAFASVLSFHAFSLVSFHRPEIRLEQAKSQWQWHSQRPDSGWVLISTYTGMHLLEQKHFSKNGILLLIA